MKKSMVILMLCLVSASVFGQGVDFFKGSFEEALTQAGKENKKIIVHFWSPF